MVPRKVRKAIGYEVPETLAQGEKAFIADVVAGVDLRPYLSTRLDRANLFDAMLFDFGIQHFHTSMHQHPTKPKYKARTEPILFAFVTKTDMYCLGFFPHGAWSQQRLLDIVYENWPELLERFAARDALALSHSYTDDEVASLRKAGMNTPTRRPDGTVHFGPGTGVATDGSSLIAAMKLINLANVSKDLERQVSGVIDRMIDDGEIPGSPELRIEKVAERMHVRGDGVDIRLDADLLPPPL
ncbi:MULTISPECIES: hypothetical protein [unclassified Sphingomonas]|uniref:hypothetical protein n=1 Tax=Sphingomonas sp. PvP015 TaxID=3156388 RepID=UPI0033987B96